MSAHKQSAIVSRNYRPDSGCMESALELLLKKPVKEGRPSTSGPDDAKEIKDVRAGSQCTR